MEPSFRLLPGVTLFSSREGMKGLSCHFVPWSAVLGSSCIKAAVWDSSMLFSTHLLCWKYSSLCCCGALLNTSCEIPSFWTMFFQHLLDIVACSCCCWINTFWNSAWCVLHESGQMVPTCFQILDVYQWLFFRAMSENHRILLFGRNL